MQWVTLLSQQTSLEMALQEIGIQARAQLPQADLGILFISSAFVSEYPRVLPLVHQLLPIKVLVGCSASGVIGGGLEIEEDAAISLTLARLPDVGLHPFYLEPGTLPDLDASPATWEDYIGIPNHAQPHFVLFADGFSGGVTDLLQGLDFAYPQGTKVGGLLSTASATSPHGLFLNDRLYRQGIVGVALTGNIRVDSVVAQGCRPVGSPLRVSAAEGNVITSLEDRPPLPLVKAMVEQLPPQEQNLIRYANAIAVGIVTDPFKQDPQPGDFLVRMIVGLDPKSGAIAVGDRLRPGQRIQLHVRDAETAAEDLRRALEQYRLAMQTPPAGALLFACVARGVTLYQTPHVDSSLMRSVLGDIPLGGFFSNGEIGPVGGTTYLHGFTAVFALFRPAYP